MDQCQLDLKIGGRCQYGMGNHGIFALICHRCQFQLYLPVRHRREMGQAADAIR